MPNLLGYSIKYMSFQICSEIACTSLYTTSVEEIPAYINKKTSV